MFAASAEKDPSVFQGEGLMRTAALPSVAPRPSWRPSTDHLVVLLDQLDTGLIVVDGHGHILLANDAAHHELNSGGVIKREHGALAVNGPSVVALRRALTEAVDAQRHQLVTLRAGELMLVVAVQPLRTPGHAPLALVLLQRRQLCPNLVVEMLASQHALTLAERRVLSGLLEGKRIATVAAEHGVQVSTVRSQAAALRHKFGVRRLEDLIRLAAELPPMAPMMPGLVPQRPPARAERMAHRPPPRTGRQAKAARLERELQDPQPRSHKAV